MRKAGDLMLFGPSAAAPLGLGLFGLGMTLGRTDATEGYLDPAAVEVVEICVDRDPVGVPQAKMRKWRAPVTGRW